MCICQLKRKFPPPALRLPSSSSYFFTSVTTTPPIRCHLSPAHSALPWPAAHLILTLLSSSDLPSPCCCTSSPLCGRASSLTAVASATHTSCWPQIPAQFTQVISVQRNVSKSWCLNYNTRCCNPYFYINNNWNNSVFQHLYDHYFGFTVLQFGHSFYQP